MSIYLCRRGNEKLGDFEKRSIVEQTKRISHGDNGHFGDNFDADADMSQRNSL